MERWRNRWEIFDLICVLLFFSPSPSLLLTSTCFFKPSFLSFPLISVPLQSLSFWFFFLNLPLRGLMRVLALLQCVLFTWLALVCVGRDKMCYNLVARCTQKLNCGKLHWTSILFLSLSKGCTVSWRPSHPVPPLPFHFPPVNTSLISSSHTQAFCLYDFIPSIFKLCLIVWEVESCAHVLLKWILFMGEYMGECVCMHMWDVVSACWYSQTSCTQIQTCVLVCQITQVHFFPFQVMTCR